MKAPETWQAIRELIAFRNQAPALAPVEQTAPQPLSFPQERQWFLQQLHPESTAFHLPHLLHLRGTLNVSALERSLNALRERHSILRTIFTVNERNRPVQVVQPFEPLALPVTSIVDLPMAEQEMAVAHWIATTVQQPFVLQRDPGMRARLLNRRADEHLLLLVFHHIVYDFWSQSLMLSDLQSLYTAFSAGQDPVLPSLPIQYCEFAAWQQSWLGDVSARAPLVTYWQDRLAGVSPLRLETPLANDRRASSAFFSLSPELTAAFEALTRREAQTLYTTLHAAFDVLWNRYTGQTDVLISGLMANRSRPELNSLIGNFVNLVALRTDLSGNPTFVEIMDRVQRTMAGAIRHQDLPVQFLNGSVRLSQVVFALRNTPRHEMVLPGLKTQFEVLPSPHADFDLFFDLVEQSTGQGRVISGPVTYDRDCFTDATMTQLLEDFTRLLTIVVANPEIRLDDLPAFAWPRSAVSSINAKRAVARRVTSTGSRPQSSMEERLVAIWRLALSQNDVDLDATFFELGGNSISLMQVLQQIQSSLAPEITPVHLLQYPTIHSLATYLSERHFEPAHGENGTPTVAAPAYVQAGHERAERQRAARMQMKRPRKEPLV